MRKASEYRAHAQECRSLAKQMKPGWHSEKLLQMASDWEEMATYRARLIVLYPELAKEGEREEEAGETP